MTFPLLGPEAAFLPLLGLGLPIEGRAAGGSKEVLAPAPLSLLNQQRHLNHNKELYDIQDDAGQSPT